MQMKANKVILVVVAVFLIQILRGLTLIFLIPSVVIPKRLWNLSFFFRHLLIKRISTQTTLSKFPDQWSESYYADVWENTLLFPSKSKNNLGGIDISQPTP